MREVIWISRDREAKRHGCVGAGREMDVSMVMEVEEAEGDRLTGMAATRDRRIRVGVWVHRRRGPRLLFLKDELCCGLIDLSFLRSKSLFIC